MKKFDYFKPKTLEEALVLLAQYGEKAKLIAGGTDVIVMIKQKTMAPDILISLQGIPGLDRSRRHASAGNREACHHSHVTEHWRQHQRSGGAPGD